MGASHSSRREGIENTVEYKEGKKLQELRDKLFPPADSREFLKDKSPSLVYSEANGFKLFVGSIIHANDTSTLQELGIARIVNMAAGEAMATSSSKSGNFETLLIKASDVEAYDLSKHFDEVTGFIEKGREEGAGVFIHCMAGVSRSVTVTIAFLMKHCNMKLKEAASQVKSQRSQAYPNRRFIETLVNYEKQLKKENSSKSTM